MTDQLRAMCAELLAALESEGYAHWITTPDEDELCLRARALLDQEPVSPPYKLPQPVAVSERLPGPEDCDAEGRCWMFGNIEGDWRLISTINPGIPKLKYCFSHWLPANALPTPEAIND